jgi:uncharacterized protein (DUF2147 family)
MILFAGLIFTVLQSKAQPYQADDLKGYWLNEEKDATVEIFDRDGKYFGKIVWLKDPIDEETGKPKLDDENDDPELQKRPIMGLELLKEFEFEGEDLWMGGTIYDPDNGKTYKCKITMKDIDFLNIRGYIGKAWMGLGRTTEWTRTEYNADK